MKIENEELLEFKRLAIEAMINFISDVNGATPSSCFFKVEELAEIVALSSVDSIFNFKKSNSDPSIKKG